MVWGSACSRYDNAHPRQESVLPDLVANCSCCHPFLVLETSNLSQGLLFLPQHQELLSRLEPCTGSNALVTVAADAELPFEEH